MGLTENENLTRINYDAKANEWLERSGGRSRPSFWTDELVGFDQNFVGSAEDEEAMEIRKTKLVVEIGSGPATDGKHIEGLGYKSISFDYSKTMLDIAKEIRPSAKLAQMDIYNTGFKDDSFDGFLATATILHLEKPKKALKEIVRITKDKGVGFISVKEGSEEDSGIDPRTGYYFNYFTNETFTALLENAGFEIIGEPGTKTGTPRHHWLTYLVRVNKW